MPEQALLRDWRPGAGLDALRLRARLLAGIREFFAIREVLEVDTPALSPAAASDPALASFAVRYQGPGPLHGQNLYLHTSPEFPMKRLLAAGSGSIYQLAKVFRDGEAGSRHNPEFTLLEWYRPGYDHHRLMDEARDLVIALLGQQPVRRLSYRDVFLTHLGLDPFRTEVPELAAVATVQGLVPPPSMPTTDPDPWLDLLLSHCIEPRLGPGLVFVYDYPASQAALARLRWDDPHGPPVGERFELYLDGVELANGFHELADGAEQRRRFEADNAARQARGLPVMPLDGRLLAALDAGLPDCAGVALGVDRLVMQAAGADSLEAVLAFAINRA